MNRRQYLTLALAGLAQCATTTSAQIKSAQITPALKPSKKAQDKATTALFGAFDMDKKALTKELAEQSTHYAACVDTSKTVNQPSVQQLAIPFRAHDCLPLNTQRALFFGRRPHPQMIVCDFSAQQTQLINAAQHRHYYGHGCLHKSSNTLFTTENDTQSYQKPRGVIGIRDAHTLQLLGEYPSYGVGPHDIQLMPDNKTLVVANGGIHTHPDFGRRKLNLNTMQPSLVLIDIASGKKRDEYRLEHPQLSIRHLDVSAQGGVAVATQYQGQSKSRMPDYLLAYLDESGLRSFRHNQAFTQQCRGYIGDVAVDDSARIMLASSPRGNTLSVWDIQQKRLIQTLSLPSPCGLCFDAVGQRFLVSNQQGTLYQVYASQQKWRASEYRHYPDYQWDNHMKLLA